MGNHEVFPSRSVTVAGETVKYCVCTSPAIYALLSLQVELWMVKARVLMLITAVCRMRRRCSGWQSGCAACSSPSCCAASKQRSPASWRPRRRRWCRCTSRACPPQPKPRNEATTQLLSLELVQQTTANKAVAPVHPVHNPALKSPLTLTWDSGRWRCCPCRTPCTRRRLTTSGHKLPPRADQRLSQVRLRSIGPDPTLNWLHKSVCLGLRLCGGGHTSAYTTCFNTELLLRSPDATTRRQVRCREARGGG